MSVRPSLTTAYRRASALVSQQCAQLSTTSKAQSFKTLLDGPSSRSAPVRHTGSRASALGQNLSRDGEESPQRGSTESLMAIYNRAYKGRSNAARQRQQAQEREATNKELGDATTSQNYMRQAPRRWKQGDVYAPRDLSPFEMTKWRGQTAVKKDVLDTLGINPLDNYRNFTMISEFITPHGRIKHSEETGLRPVNQRKMAKAIRRAIGMGLHPSVHKHPELILRDSQNVSQQSRAGEGLKPSNKAAI